MTTKYRAGSSVEVLVPKIDPKRGVLPQWDAATFVEITTSGYVRVKIRDPQGNMVFRVFSPDDVRTRGWKR